MLKINRYLFFSLFLYCVCSHAAVPRLRLSKYDFNPPVSNISYSTDQLVQEAADEMITANQKDDDQSADNDDDSDESADSKDDDSDATASKNDDDSEDDDDNDHDDSDDDDHTNDS